MKLYAYFFCLFIFSIIGCNDPVAKDVPASSEESTNRLPYFTYSPESLFPGDGSLNRAEDGVSLQDGRIVVVDQTSGLRLIQPDGSHRPFGDFAAAGYVYNPPEQVTGPNGVVLEHDGQHLLMADVGDGKIYRINVVSEDVKMIYDHPYGVNTMYRDKAGAIWFTQSAKSTSIAEMFAAANVSVPTGAIYRMADLESEPMLIADSLYFANGITMDKDEKYLFVSETMMDRVHKFEVDVNNGKAEYSEVAANVESPDNILIDQKGRLIVASPLFNQVVAVDFENHSQHILFDGSTKENLKISNEWVRRSHLGLERLEIVSPDLFHPLPGLLTGMFFSNDGQTLYITNLGNALMKYSFDSE